MSPHVQVLVTANKANKANRMSSRCVLVMFAVVLLIASAALAAPGEKIQVDVVAVSASSTAEQSFRHAFTRAFVQDRTIKWGLYQAIAAETDTRSPGERLDSYLDFIDAYLAQPPTVLRPKSFGELEQQTTALMQGPLLIEHEMDKLLVNRILPPRFEIDDSLLSHDEMGRARELLSSLELNVTVRPLADSWFAVGPVRELGKREIMFFDSISDLGRAGRRFRAQVRSLKPRMKDQAVEALTAKVVQQVDEAVARAENLIDGLSIGDQVSNRFLQVFLKSYLRGLPRSHVIQIASHLIQFGYPLESKPMSEVLRLILERTGPAALKVVQSVARNSTLSEEFKRIFVRFEKDGPYVPSYFLESAALALTPPISTLSFDEKPVGTGSIAQVHVARLRTGNQVEKVAVRFIKPGIRELFQGESKALSAAITAVEADSELRDSRFGHMRKFVDDLKTLIAIELDATTTEQNQIVAEKVYRGIYHGSDGWSVEFSVPGVKGKATPDGLMQTWASGLSYDEFLERYPEHVALFQQTLVAHFFKKLIDGYAHGDLHPGNVKIEMEPKSRLMRVHILDLGMFQSVPLQIQQAMFRIFRGLQLNSKDTVVDGLFRLQDTSRSQLSQAELNAIVERAFNNEELSGLARLGPLAKAILQSGYAMPLPAAGILRSAIALQAVSSGVGARDLFGLVFQNILSGDLSLTKLAMIADIKSGINTDNVIASARRTKDSIQRTTAPVFNGVSDSVSTVTKAVSKTVSKRVKGFFGSLLDQTALGALPTERLNAGQPPDKCLDLFSSSRRGTQ